MEETPFQPATNWMRSIELPVLAASLPSQGCGLDVGCGDGALSRILGELVAGQREMIGIDIDPPEAALAKAANVYAWVAIARADQIPLSDACLDFAFANSVLEHIPDLGAVLAEIARCLKPGGLFVATVPSSQFHECLRGPGLLRRISREEYLREVDARLSHFHYWSPGRWDRELRDVGLEPEPISGYFSRAQVQIWERWSNRTGGLLYRLSRRKRRPIEIQRTLGMRRGLPGSLSPLGSLIARLVGPRAWSEDQDASDLNGCFLVRRARPLRPDVQADSARSSGKCLPA